jgi:N-methylhydantoinase B
MTVIYNIDGHTSAPRVVRGGQYGSLASAESVKPDVRHISLPSVSVEVVRPGEWIVGRTNGGGGYGDPLERDAERVRADVFNGWVGPDVARQVYGVVFKEEGGTLAVDVEATAMLRKDLSAACFKNHCSSL